MDLSSFEPGIFKQQLEYKSFSPNYINHPWVISSIEINKLLSEANRFVGELNAFSQIVPNVDFFIYLYITKEANKSSKIEGTQTNLEEALMNKEDISPEKRDDWEEVRNYIDAINNSIEKLEELPISNRLLKQAHKILLSGVRGKHKLPGDYRKSQNWIGATLRDASFIPPHHTEINELMSDLEKFIHNTEFQVPHLIKIAIIHYQFETIHPFLDGNGRLGRLLITLYLVSSKVIEKPALYLSDFFEKNRHYYYDNLMSVRLTGNMEQWIKFFLVGVIETAKDAIQVFKDILSLQQEIESARLPVFGTRAKKNAIKLLENLYKFPVVPDAKYVDNLLGTSSSTTNRLIDKFVELKILSEITGYKRNRMYIFKPYLDIFSATVEKKSDI